MMLTIDIGNSRIKWAEFESGEIQRHGAFEYDDKNIEQMLDKAGLPDTTEVVRISCVSTNEIKERFIKWLGVNGFNAFHFAETQSKQCNVVNAYEMTSNLGVDRWLAMIAAYKLYATRNAEITCVIDCGTAITLDILDIKGRHLGGLIMPGYNTMLKSLLKGTGNIDKMSHEFGGTKSDAALCEGLASSTQDAVAKGCAQLIVLGISGIIDRYQKESAEKMRYVVTGGDGEWVSDTLACVNIYNPFLVLQGLQIASAETQK